MRDKKPFFAILILLIINSQVNIYSQTKNEQNTQVTDYSAEKNWSIISKEISYNIDVFFVHPTTYGPPANGKYLASLSDSTLNKNTDLYAINWMTSAFEKNCNIFAPRYRQVNIEVLSMPDDKEEMYLETPIKDITAALLYYLENFNSGRPFILASHSQGSKILQEILIKNPNIIDKEKLVAAYMPGWTFTNENIEEIGIPLSLTPDEVGGMIIWNTIGQGGKSPTLKSGARCVNPLSWTTDTANYTAKLNAGAKILTKDHKEIHIDHFTSARINSIGGLEIPMPDSKIYNSLNMPMGPNCYHNYDYDFFFNNIIMLLVFVSAFHNPIQRNI